MEVNFSVDQWVFDKNPDICFGIIIGKNLKNSITTDKDSKRLSKSEEYLKSIIELENIKTHPSIEVYRNALKSVNINPNKYMNSVEAMQFISDRMRKTRSNEEFLISMNDR